MTNIRFRGVATKYLNNYIVYNNFVTFAKESFMEKIKEPLHKRWVICYN